MKKHLLSLTVALLPLTMAAQTTVTQDGMTYTLSGTSASNYSATLTSGAGATGDITIPSTITITSDEGDKVYKVDYIGATAFTGNTNITSVVISEGIYNIQQSSNSPTTSSKRYTGAFSHTTNLKSVIFPSTLRSLGYAAFYKSGITSADLSHTKLTTLQYGTFARCADLAEVLLPESLTTINSSDFEWEAETLSNCAAPFGFCTSLKAINLPANIRAIGSGAFQGAGITEMTSWPASAKSIGSKTFSGCKNLTHIDLPEGITSIGPNAFSGTAISSFEIPNTVTSLSISAFAKCTALTRFIFEDGSKLTTLPKTLFEGCTSLTEITLPDGVTSIEDFSINYSMFNGCTALRKVTLPANLAKIPNNMFYNLPALADVVITAGVKEIGNSAFQLTPMLKTLTIPEGVQTIGNSAFVSSGLTSVHLPATLSSLGERAFYECLSLASITFDPDCALTTIKKRTFAYTPITSIILPNSVTTIETTPSNSSNGSSPFQGCSKLASVTLPENNPEFTEIPQCLFFGMIMKSPTSADLNASTPLTEVNIPSSVTTIGNKAFYKARLTNVTLPDGLTTIEDNAFYYVPLQTLDIPGSVSSIGQQAFYMSKFSSGAIKILPLLLKY